MKTSMLRRVRKHFPDGSAPRRVVRHNRRAWVRSIRFLGERWLLAQPVQREAS